MIAIAGLLVVGTGLAAFYAADAVDWFSSKAVGSDPVSVRIVSATSGPWGWVSSDPEAAEVRERALAANQALSKAMMSDGGVALGVERVQLELIGNRLNDLHVALTPHIGSCTTPPSGSITFGRPEGTTTIPGLNVDVSSPQPRFSDTNSTASPAPDYFDTTEITLKHGEAQPVAINATTDGKNCGWYIDLTVRNTGEKETIGQNEHWRVSGSPPLGLAKKITVDYVTYSSVTHSQPSNRQVAVAPDFFCDPLNPAIGSPLDAAAKAYCQNGPTLPGATEPTSSRNASSSATQASGAATAIVKLAPVNTSYHALPGWSVKPEAGLLDCNIQQPSPSAVTGNIYSCGPTAASADACWPSPAAFVMLCLPDPWNRQLTQQQATTTVHPVAPAPRPDPIGLELSDGDHCRLRNGGAWGTPQQHPDWVGWYSCQKRQAIWGPRDTSGIDRSSTHWTVQAGNETGPLSTLTVTKAYFLTTAP